MIAKPTNQQATTTKKPLEGKSLVILKFSIHDGYLVIVGILKYVQFIDYHIVLSLLICRHV